MPIEDLGLWLDNSADPVLFVIGSAISYASPAGAPSAHTIVRATAHGLAEAADPLGRLSRLPFIEAPPRELLPESLYAAIDQICGQGIHSKVWGTLSVDRTTPNGPRPNAGHYFVAVATARTRGVIITTNFDPFLEQALAELAIPHQSLTGLDVWNGRCPVGGKVLVLKVHGDAGVPESLVSKAPDLARTRRVLRDLPWVTPFGRALVVGYSGRDFDVFPWLVGESAVGEVCWLDRDFPAHHRSHLVPSCRQLMGTADTLAEAALEAWAAAGDGYAGQALDALASTPDPTADLGRAAVAAVRQALEDLRPDPGAARWALARAFADIGRHTWAVQILSGPGPSSGSPEVQAELSLLQSFLSASQDRYRDSILEARRATMAARRAGRPYLQRSLAVRGSLQRSFARTLYETITVSLPPDLVRVQSRSLNWRGRRTLGRMRRSVRGLGQVIAFLLTAAGHAPAGVKAVRRAARAGFGSTVPEYRLACDYLETLIRAQGFLVRIVPPLGRLQTRALLRLDRAAHDVGYLSGAINVAKYLRRTKFGTTDAAAVTLGRLAVLDDAVPKAIEARDVAARLTRQKVLTDAQRNELDEATAQCLAAAAVAGAPTLQLQALMLRRQHGLSTTDPGRIEELLSSTQVRSVNELAHDLKSALT